MLRKFKKFMAAISAVALCVVPITNSLSVNAATTYENTYRIYFDVSTNSALARYDFRMSYDRNMSAGYFEIGNLGGEISSGGGGSQTGRHCGANYTNDGAIYESGTIFSFKIYSNGTFEENCNEEEDITETAFYINGSEMVNNPVTRDVVLVGDANDNGMVEVADAVLVQQYLVSPSTANFSAHNARAADANGDGVITMADAIMIQEYVAQIIPNF